MLPLETPGERKSYTPHVEGDVPVIVMEFLSDTDGVEYSVKPTYPPGKWFFYEQVLKVPLYAIFEPSSNQLELYQLVAGRYELQEPNELGRYWIAAEMGLFLGIWQGKKEGRTGYWLRWWDETGNLLLWAVERLEQERQRAEQLAEQLRQLGVDPDQLPELRESEN